MPGGTRRLETPARLEDRLARRGGPVELLRLPAALMRAGTAVRASLYDRGWLPVARLDVPVVSVGNLTVGGTGKTPLVEWVARHLLARGRRPGLLSRGYGARPRRRGARERDASNDEAAMLARRLPDVPHVADPDRAAGGTRLQERGVDVVVLDDGFQHRRLHRDVDVVTVDAQRPWGLPADGGGRAVRALLPRGFLREAPGALARADALVVTRADQVPSERLDRLRDELHRLAPAAPVLLSRHSVLRVRDGEGGVRALEELAGEEAVLVSGIGNPDGFEATARALGVRVREHRRFPDHHAYDAADAAALAGIGPILTTAKDAVKLEPLGVTVRALEIGLELTSGAPVLEALLDALPAGAAERARLGLHEGLHG